MKHSVLVPVELPADLLSRPPGILSHLDNKSAFSIDSLRRGWVRVRSVKGAPGVDGVTIQSFEANLEENLRQLQQELFSGRYRPSPVKRLLVPKPGGGLRPLALWTLRDKIVQRVVYDLIAPYFESCFLDCSFGFRPDRAVADAIQAIVAHRQANRQWVADADIKACFDSLDPALLMEFVRQRVRVAFILRLIESWLRARVFNDLQGSHTPAGASQGSVISPLLANIYLHHVDVQLTGQGYHLVRYADDMVICCQRKEEARRALEAARLALQKVKLQLNINKSRIVHFDEGFQFLGFFFLRNEHFCLSNAQSIKGGH